MFEQFLNTDVSFFSVEVIPIILVVILLEAILSADNAVALAAIIRSLPDPNQEKWALRYGVIGALALRVILIFAATWVMKYWQFELAGSLYLLWLSGKFFLEKSKEGHDAKRPVRMANKLWQVVLLVSFTDLAFSIDSVTVSIAVAQETWLVLIGGVVGIISLRFLAGLFIKKLEEFTHLESAGYFTVLLVGLRLLLKVFSDSLVPPEWLMITCIALIFLWGFSKRELSDASEASADRNN
ncbi:TerC family protein [Pseudanabaena sp. 'Roaring Creek']|uniref:TerC family protein n=1 Tax=Pseudanabaena sp. 'Roaring Creek' TaxID=1681830 RepID=UPI0006D7DA52|nr:hypothetical protein [Pseudanabaena sp. 'Roaring Creek']